MSRHIRVAALLLSFGTASVALAQGWEQWTGSKPIAIDSAASGIASDVVEAPILIRLHSGNFAHFLDTKDDGSDIRFATGPERVPVKHHIEKFDPLSDVALIWVHMPKLVAASPDNALTLYYGNPKATSDGKAAYDAPQVAVYHFDAPGVPQDRSAYGHHAIQSTAEHRPASLIGGGVAFAGSQKITLPVLPVAPDNTFTFSSWIKTGGAQTDGVLFARGDATRSLVVGIAGTKLYARIVNGAASETPRTVEVAPNAWHHIAVVGGPRLAVYLDGREVAALDVAMPALAGEITLGANGNKQFFTGEMDEVQLANTARSADWIKFAASSQGSDANLITYGEDETAGGGSTSHFATILQSVTVDGWAVIVLLAVMAVISWWVMVTKGLVVRRMERDNAEFLDSFKKLESDPGVLDRDDDSGTASDTSDFSKALFGTHDHFQSSPIYRIYHVGVQEIKHRFGKTDPKLLQGKTLSPQSIDAIRASLDATLVRETQRLNRMMVMLTIAISGGPFLGLLGTVVGVMITFAAIAATGDVNINAIAPGIAGALVATVAGLAVAIPALFGYNYLVSRIKDITVDMHVFVDEFISKVAENYGADKRLSHEDASRKRAV